MWALNVLVMSRSPEDRYGKANIEKATDEVITQYNLKHDEARRLAIKALNGLDSHGCDFNNFDTVKETIRIVVASWLDD